MSNPFWTLGHSNRTLAEFTELLRASGIELVVDVRRHPGSARHPQFDEDALSAALAEDGVGLRHVAGLTGRRPVSSEVPWEVNAWWENRSFHNYADHALSAGFRRALDGLRDAGAAHRTAVMCSEAVWWRCHRRIIADHLLAHEDAVFHILGRNRLEAARLSAGAVVGDDRGVTYPAAR